MDWKASCILINEREPGYLGTMPPHDPGRHSPPGLPLSTPPFLWVHNSGCKINLSVSPSRLPPSRFA